MISRRKAVGADPEQGVYLAARLSVEIQASYEAASQDLLTYAGIPIDARQLQRLVSLMAPVMNRWRQAQQPTLPGATCGEVMCIGTDGTGAPMRRRYLRGRKGKQGGRAPTREVKVGTVFTHRKPSQPDQRAVGGSVRQSDAMRNPGRTHPPSA